jgi:hypothetical protein
MGVYDPHLLFLVIYGTDVGIGTEEDMLGVFDLANL